MRWTVRVSWECEVEAEDEGYALMDADGMFNFMSEARAELNEPEEEDAGESL
jgi:hypothetical protein